MQLVVAKTDMHALIQVSVTAVRSMIGVVVPTCIVDKAVKANTANAIRSSIPMQSFRENDITNKANNNSAKSTQRNISL
jgi:hypothetical protein